MNAAAANLWNAWTALGAFLRGFIGVARDSDASSGGNDAHDDHPCARPDAPSAASVRAALTARAARRPSCC